MLNKWSCSRPVAEVHAGRRNANEARKWREMSRSLGKAPPREYSQPHSSAHWLPSNTEPIERGSPPSQITWRMREGGGTSLQSKPISLKGLLPVRVGING
jgi:hypothetical protein